MQRVCRARLSICGDDYVILQGGADILRNAVPKGSPIRIGVHASVPCVFSEKEAMEKLPINLDGKVIELILADGSKVKLADFSQTTFELRERAARRLPRSSSSCASATSRCEPLGLFLNTTTV